MKSVLIIGLGRFGRHMAQKLIEEGNDVLAVEKSEESQGFPVSMSLSEPTVPISVSSPFSSS